MKDLVQLILVLKRIIDGSNKKGSFEKIIKEITGFYMDNLLVNNDEVAIFLANNEKTVLSFAAPQYLINSGMIPVSSTDAIVASVFRRGKPVIENNMQLQKHLSIFEIIKTPDNKIKPILKMMGALIEVNDEKLGVIEISRRGSPEDTSGKDFDDNELNFLSQSMVKLAPFIKQVMPEDFRGQLG